MTAGRRAGAGIPPPTTPSGGSMPSWRPPCIGCSQVTSPVQTTPLMDHHTASIPLLHHFSHQSQSQKTFMDSSSTMTTLSVTHSASNINFARLPPLHSTKARLTHVQELNTSSKVVTRAPHLIKAVLPYPLNLTPSSSDLRPHCAAKDRLEKWLPHPDTLTALGCYGTRSRSFSFRHTFTTFNY